MRIGARDQVAHGDQFGRLRILRQVGQPPRDRLGAQAGEVGAVEQGAALGGRERAAQHAQQRGLAAAVGADDGGEGAGGDGQRQAVQHLAGAVGQRHVAQRQRGGRGLRIGGQERGGDHAFSSIP